MAIVDILLVLRLIDMHILLNRFWWQVYHPDRYRIGISNIANGTGGLDFHVKLSCLINLDLVRVLPLFYLIAARYCLWRYLWRIWSEYHLVAGGWELTAIIQVTPKIIKYDCIVQTIVLNKIQRSPGWLSRCYLRNLRETSGPEGYDRRLECFHNLQTKLRSNIEWDLDLYLECIVLVAQL